MNKMLVNLLFCLVFLFKICDSQVLQFGKCAEVETVKYFDIEKFLGKWYEMERFPTWYEDYGQCAYKTINACGRRIEILHGFIRDGIQYVLHVNSSYSNGDEAVFEIEKNNVDPIGIPLLVISTDYSNYALVYGCQYDSSINIKYILAWILSRETTIEPDVIEMARQMLNSIPYASSAFLEAVSQDEERCPYHWTAHVQADLIDSKDSKVL